MNSKAKITTFNNSSSSMKKIMTYSIFVLVLCSSFIIVVSGCSGKKASVKDSLDQSIDEVGNFNQSKKYIKAGVTVVYLTGTPYEIGFAHGKLCKDEIRQVNQYYWNAYDKLKDTPDGKWLPLSRRLGQNIPQEYILEMKGIADGAGIEYDKILFLNTLVTISEHSKCFAFSFKQAAAKIITVRQIDISNSIPSKNITSPSTRRLDFGNQFLKKYLEVMNIEKAIELARASKITWRWNPTVHNRQSIIFSPATLDLWVAVPPNSDYIPASYGPYIGFNLLQELYGTAHEPIPKAFPSH